MKSTIVEVYKEKAILQKRIFNMMKRFETKNNLRIINVRFFDENDPEDENNKDEYTQIVLDVNLENDPKKIKI